ncbi:LPXTG cell wall anchor domain-containing protein [Lactobacillus delbrueckii]|uniref:LPXTG cell wall anchor domain-containing protein n=1 Tax=Lactobacillus delbrueckii TaxID=1584 RepID=UPI0022E95844|nr:LPXTG cell wall anchor domain-containing protein [Lactobacillus delbrueckii]
MKNSTPQHFTVKAGETAYVTVKNYKPTVPIQPQKSSVPKSSSSSSSKPKVPTQPQKSNVPSQKKKGFLPQTGEIASWLAVFAGLVLLVFGLFLAVKSRRKKDQ